MDKRDTTLNGIIVGLAVSVIAWFLFSGLNKLVPSVFPVMADGFSQSLIFIMAVVANIIPVQMFNNQDRGLAMRGVISVIMLGVLAWLGWFLATKFGLIAN